MGERRAADDRRLPRDAGLADPRFEEIATRFRVTILTARVATPSLDDTDQTIIDALSDGEGRLTSEIATLIGLTHAPLGRASLDW